ncbi:MAG: hypothetical protein DRJ42_30385 [Deltaproteobacteria bacterium]|nr:MAG: hypothetical protein DRJ42_30385 [Deltaproteobacteria bacterium]
MDSGSTEFAGFGYDYDKMGNPLFETRSHDGGKGDVYGYDEAYRLTGALIGSDDPSNEVSDGVWDDGDEDYVDKVEFNMDDVSNRTSVVTTPDGGQSSTVSYTSNSLNQYTAIGQANRSHDDNGNLIDDGTCDFSFDYRNNLVEVMEGETVIMEAECCVARPRVIHVAG